MERVCLLLLLCPVGKFDKSAGDLVANVQMLREQNESVLRAMIEGRSQSIKR